MIAFNCIGADKRADDSHGRSIEKHGRTMSGWIYTASERECVCVRENCRRNTRKTKVKNKQRNPRIYNR